MMKLRRLSLWAVAAVAAPAMLVSCTTTQSVPLSADALLVAPYIVRNGEAFSVEHFFAQMPGWMAVSFGDVSFDAATGAMVIRDLHFSPDGIPEISLRVERADIWGGDSVALEAIMSGAAIDDMRQIFDRASFQGIHTKGLNAPDGSARASLTIDKMVFDGLSAQSLSLRQVEGMPDFARIIWGLMAASGSYALDGAAYSNMNMQASESGGGEISANVARGFIRGYDRGATQFQRMAGFSMTTTAPTAGPDDNVHTQISQRIIENFAAQERPEDKILQPWMRAELDRILENPIAYITANTAPGADSQKSEIDVVEIHNSDISGALKWLAKLELPPITQTNLIDFGTMTILGNRVLWNDKLVYSIARTEITASDFYWLIPSDYTQTDSGITIATRDLLDQVFASLEDADAGELAQISEAITALGLETIVADSHIDWRWNGETGALDTGSSLNIHDLASFAGGINLGGPSLVGWDQLVRAGVDSDAIMGKISFGGFNASIVDDQLLDRAYAYAASQMGSGSGDDLRQSLPSLLRLSGGQVTALNPRMPSYIEALAIFLGEGGTLTITANPPEAVMLPTLLKAIEAEPQTLPDLLNLTVERH